MRATPRLRLAPNDAGRPARHHVGMGTLHTIAASAWRESWNRAFWPSLALSLLIAMDGYTRGPSISGMVLSFLLLH